MSPTSRRAVGVQRHLLVSERAALKELLKQRTNVRSYTNGRVENKKTLHRVYAALPTKNEEVFNSHRHLPIPDNSGKGRSNQIKSKSNYFYHELQEQCALAML